MTSSPPRRPCRRRAHSLGAARAWPAARHSRVPPLARATPRLPTANTLWPTRAPASARRARPLIITRRRHRRPSAARKCHTTQRRPHRYRTCQPRRLRRPHPAATCSGPSSLRRRQLLGGLRRPLATHARRVRRLAPSLATLRRSTPVGTATSPRPPPKTTPRCAVVGVPCPPRAPHRLFTPGLSISLRRPRHRPSHVPVTTPHGSCIKTARDRRRCPAAPPRCGAAVGRLARPRLPEHPLPSRLLQPPQPPSPQRPLRLLRARLLQLQRSAWRGLPVRSRPPPPCLRPLRATAVEATSRVCSCVSVA